MGVNFPQNTSSVKEQTKNYSTFYCGLTHFVTRMFSNWPLMGPANDKITINIVIRVQTHSSHCSDHSAWGPDFSLTEVWNFSFPKLIVTKASFVPETIYILSSFFPIIFSGSYFQVWCRGKFCIFLHSSCYLWDLYNSYRTINHDPLITGEKRRWEKMLYHSSPSR